MTHESVPLYSTSPSESLYYLRTQWFEYEVPLVTIRAGVPGYRRDPLHYSLPSSLGGRDDSRGGRTEEASNCRSTLVSTLLRTIRTHDPRYAP